MAMWSTIPVIVNGKVMLSFVVYYSQCGSLYVVYFITTNGLSNTITIPFVPKSRSAIQVSCTRVGMSLGRSTSLQSYSNAAALHPFAALLL